MQVFEDELKGKFFAGEMFLDRLIETRFRWIVILYVSKKNVVGNWPSEL